MNVNFCSIKAVKKESKEPTHVDADSSVVLVRGVSFGTSLRSWLTHQKRTLLLDIDMAQWVFSTQKQRCVGLKLRLQKGCEVTEASALDVVKRKTVFQTGALI